jgi:predicted GNAT family N-acyltransferase
MEAVARRARAEGRDFLELDARVTAIAFYERLGYVAKGETFLSARTGTPHRRMRRTL